MNYCLISALCHHGKCWACQETVGMTVVHHASLPPSELVVIADSRQFHGHVSLPDFVIMTYSMSFCYV